MLPAPGQQAARDAIAGIARANEDERYRRLEAHEALWKGLRYEYECRPSWWDATVPLRERAPCVVYPIARSAGRRLISLVFGEGRFPTLTTQDPRLTTEEQQYLAAELASIVEAAALRLRMRDLMEQGLATGTAVAVCAIREGHFDVDLLPAKWCSAQRDGRGRVLSLEIRYKYREGDGLYWYRRTITPEADTVYLPCLVEEQREPTWVPDTERSRPGVGFVPAVWTRNDPDPTDNGCDGVPLAAGLEDEMEALDFSLSQRHRNARYNGEPFIVRVLGESDEDASEGLSAERGRDGALRGWREWVAGVGSRPVGSGAIKRAPGQILTLSKGGDMKLVESSGAGAQILDGDSAALRRLILEVLEVVMADPETIAANASAALQRQLYAPMLARCDGLREVYGAALVEIAHMLLRLVRAVRGAVLLPGAMTLVALLDRVPDPAIGLRWGEYFDPTPADVQAAATAAMAANGGRPVLSHRSSVRYVAKLAGVEDVEAELQEIAKDEAGGLARVSEVLGGPARDPG